MHETIASYDLKVKDIVVSYCMESLVSSMSGVELSITDACNLKFISPTV